MQLRPFAPQISLIFIRHTWVWDRPTVCLCPSYPSQCSLFSNSVVAGLPLSSVLAVQTHGGSVAQLWFWCVWLCEEVSCVFRGSPENPSLLTTVWPLLAVPPTLGWGSKSYLLNTTARTIVPSSLRSSEGVGDSVSETGTKAKYIFILNYNVTGQNRQGHMSLFQ